MYVTKLFSDNCCRMLYVAVLFELVLLAMVLAVASPVFARAKYMCDSFSERPICCNFSIMGLLLLFCYINVVILCDNLFLNMFSCLVLLVV